MKTHFLLAAILGGVTLLAACGGGGGDADRVASADAVVNIGAANGRNTFRALENETFTFPNGVTEFGTTTATTVAIAPPATAGANSSFTVTSGGQTASGVMNFGADSCRFRITSSTFAGPPMVVGAIIDIVNCSVRLDTSGQPANGGAIDVLAFLILNAATSNGTTVSVAVTNDGNVFVNGVLVGTVTVVPVTGAGF